VFSLIIIALLDMWGTWYCQVACVSGGGTFVTLSKIITLTGKVDETLFKILVKSNLVCCSLQAFTNAGRAIAISAAGWTVGTYVKDITPEFASEADHFLANAVSHMTRHVDIAGNASETKLAELLGVDLTVKPPIKEVGKT
jgi:hypothetical protein